jgi:hypothetical protein
MPADPRSILTETQKRFLNGFFGDSANLFYLSGGTALAAYYLRHRYSDDLDFFTRHPDNLRTATSLVERAAQAAELTVERVAHRGELIQFSFSGDRHPDHPLVKVECVTDTPPPPYFAEPRRFDGVAVDHLLCIAVNKTAIHTRFEAKDYIDLYLIVRSGAYPLEELIPLAKEKIIGLDDLTIAARFDRIEEIVDLARFMRSYMLVDLDEADMVAFYKDWARRLYLATPPRVPPLENA